jgi:hypothetical protein
MVLKDASEIQGVLVMPVFHISDVFGNAIGSLELPLPCALSNAFPLSRIPHTVQRSKEGI